MEKARLIWRTPRLRWSAIVFHAILIAYSLTVIGPLLVMAISSVKTTAEIYTNPFGLPEVWQWSNYTRAWTEANFAVYFKNSLFVTITATALTILVGAMASYGLGRFEFKLNPVIYGVFVLGLMISSRLAIIPLFLLMRDLHLLNTHAALILIYIGSSMPFDVFLLTAFFRQVPKELEEAAIVEGAGAVTIFTRIMLPLVRPALATVAIFEFLGNWNDFFFPLIFLQDEKKMTIPVGLSVFFGEYATDWASLFAALAISIVPVIVMFLLMSRQFIEGLTAGAIK